MSAPALNRVAPDFKCPATGGKTVQLKALRGQKVVLYRTTRRAARPKPGNSATCMRNSGGRA